MVACQTVKQSAFLQKSSWVLELDSHEVYGCNISRPLSIDFDSGKISGFSGCNRFTGTYVLADNKSVKLGPLATTRMMCLDSNCNKTEQEFLNKLSKVSNYKVDEKQLQLFSNDTLLLSFRRNNKE
ncbi:hypothetical protein A9P82_04815 [Arachidicoccus ginsenosidimutans]|nr:hypothetical protein A9P82_04815 [Arachidicoccus sp. BS20]